MKKALLGASASYKPTSIRIILRFVKLLHDQVLNAALVETSFTMIAVSKPRILPLESSFRYRCKVIRSSSAFKRQGS